MSSNKRKNYNYSDYLELDIRINSYYTLEHILSEWRVSEKDNAILQSYIDLTDIEIDENQNKIDFWLLSKRAHLSSYIMERYKKDLDFECISKVNKNIDLVKFKDRILWDGYLENCTKPIAKPIFDLCVESIYHYFVNKYILSEYCDNAHYKIWTSLIANEEFKKYFSEYIINLNNWCNIRERIVNAHDKAMAKSVSDLKQTLKKDWDWVGIIIVDDMVDIILEKEQTDNIDLDFKKIKL